MAETWKIVGSHPDYEVSDLGRVRRTTATLRGPAGRMLLAPPDSYGYPRVGLFLDGRVRYIRVHQLVMLVFRGETPPGLEIRHLDGIKEHCWLTNLEFGTHQQNMTESVLHNYGY